MVCSNIFCIFAAKLTLIYVCCNYFSCYYDRSHLPVCKIDWEQVALGMGKHRKTIDELFLCYFCQESDNKIFWPKGDCPWQADAAA